MWQTLRPQIWKGCNCSSGTWNTASVACLAVKTHHVLGLWQPCLHGLLGSHAWLHAKEGSQGLCKKRTVGSQCPECLIRLVPAAYPQQRRGACSCLCCFRGSTHIPESESVASKGRGQCISNSGLVFYPHTAIISRWKCCFLIKVVNVEVRSKQVSESR